MLSRKNSSEDTSSTHAPQFQITSKAGPNIIGCSAADCTPRDSYLRRTSPFRCKTKAFVDRAARRLQMIRKGRNLASYYGSQEQTSLVRDREELVHPA